MKRNTRCRGNFLRAWLFLLLVGSIAGWFAFAASMAAGAAKVPRSPQLAGFGKYRVVRIDSDGITPRRVEIERGATVIWYNATAGYTAVVFSRGDELIRATRSPTLFFLAPDGTYLSAAFGSGATASTAFAKAGTFNYFVTGLPTSEGAAFARVVVR